MTYMFVCNDCGRMFIREMSVTAYSATAIHSCPHCHSIDTVRVYDSIPAIFKDDGFTKHVKEEE